MPAPWNAHALATLPGTLIFPRNAGAGFMLSLAMDRDERCPCCGDVAKLVVVDPADTEPRHVGCLVRGGQ